MILGLLSDTHGHLERTRSALSILEQQGATHLVHCGDVGGDAVLDLLFEVREEGLPLTVVPGNVDEWEPGIGLYARKLDIPFHRVQRFMAAPLRCAVFHGHDPAEMENLASDPDLDVLFTGHTHVAKDDSTRPVRIINPGAVYRAQVPSVAILDTGNGRLHTLPLAM